MTAKIQHIAVNGTELGYSVQGPQHGQPIIFLHGYAMRSTSGPYDEALALLAQHYRVYALDLRGHGLSANSTAGFGFDAVADDVLAFCRALSLDRAVFVGHSFGAVIGLLAEIRQPGSFAALCLLCPGPADHRSDPVDALNFMIEHGRDKDALRGGFEHMFAHKPPAELLEVTLDAATLLDKSVHLALQAENPQFSVDDRLGQIAAPVLLLCGQSDAVVSPSLQHDMARKLPRSKEVVFAAEGHMMPSESPAMAAREIFAFLAHDAAVPLKG